MNIKTDCGGDLVLKTGCGSCSYCKAQAHALRVSK